MEESPLGSCDEDCIKGDFLTSVGQAFRLVS